MQIENLDFNAIPQISFKDRTYNDEPIKLKEFTQFLPNKKGLFEAMEKRAQKKIDRPLLVKEIKRQYLNLETSSLVKNNIEALLSEDCFTIITAHQPALFTGPLYYIYKIFSAINLAEELSKSSEKKVIPIFINGSEDHDFDEVNHTYLFNNKISWKKEANGPVGRLNLNGINELIDDLSNIVGNKPKAQTLTKGLVNALNNAKNYNDFVKHVINNWFSKYGLVVVSMDNAAMKSAFSPIMEKELISPVSKHLVSETQSKLSEIDYSSQAFARDINLFYIDKNGRNRIEKKGEYFEILGTNSTFTKSEILQKLKENPSDFSPNVILRPLYQEFIFPNLAYVGGGGEIAYWLERKSLFDYYNVFYPVLIRRNSAMIVPSHIKKTMEKLNLQITDILDIEDQVIKNYIYKNADIELDLSDKKEKIESIFEELANDAEKIDPTLKPSILAEMANQVKKIDQIEARVRKVIKQKQEIQINQLTKVYQYLFPNQGLQERQANIIEFLINENVDIFDILKSNLNPLDNKFKVFYL